MHPIRPWSVAGLLLATSVGLQACASSDPGSAVRVAVPERSAEHGAGNSDNSAAVGPLPTPHPPGTTGARPCSGEWSVLIDFNRAVGYPTIEDAVVARGGDGYEVTSVELDKRSGMTFVHVRDGVWAAGTYEMSTYRGHLVCHRWGWVRRPMTWPTLASR
jgi:hypothetical protein